MATSTDRRVAIIGSGMGGLTACLAFAKKGFRHIDVYESALGLGFVGAGIQIAPNLIRVLDRLGCWDGSTVEKEGTRVSEAIVLDGATNAEMMRTDMSGLCDKYGYPHYAGHRASLAGTLYEAALKEPNVRFHFGETLQDVTSFAPGRVNFVIKSRDGESRTMNADILIGADGIKSVVRTTLLRELGLHGQVKETGQAAYRILLTRRELEPYPELLSFLDSNAVRRWIGEKRHVICYPIDDHRIYNISTCQPDVNFAGTANTTWTTKGSKKQMMDTFSDFNPLIKQMLSLVPDGEVVEWRMRSHTPLDEWTHGGVALIGDACHPTLPHLSQGAAMSIEDGATVAEVVGLLFDTEGAGAGWEAVTKALKVYHLLRKDRTATIVEMAAFSGRVLHLGEGAAKVERDRQFANTKGGKGANPDKWLDPEVQQMVYGHDCIKEVRERFEELFSSM
ncbi:hypothetical protein B0I35DRAFT_400046 [Stachybotrys elegans]|uniref:FAD-binding domain-containing protein n=1 Tax=Stachybotrys elegans TaxID=80388 RepID=A0A8K0WM05_9HYPO|nr:hypothetical protein B0I35DRAFT_400046 [Stachybotrys elegans]